MVIIRSRHPTHIFIRLSWFASSCDDDLVKYQIAVKELFRIVLAIEILGSSMRDKKVLFMSDNMAVLHMNN